jgi:hypothetical protein
VFAHRHAKWTGDARLEWNRLNDHELKGNGPRT